MAAEKKSGWRRWLNRKRSAPAPELHPPGFSSPGPQRQGYKIEPRSVVERRFLREVNASQVRGESLGIPNEMRSDWDRLKLQEARWAQKRAEKKPVKIQLLDASRDMKAAFRNAARVVHRSEKQREARGRDEQTPDPEPESERPPPSPGTPPAPSGDADAYFASLRARSAERVRQRQQQRSMPGIEGVRDREQDNERDG